MRPRGQRSSCDAEGWTCSRGNHNLPERREFFDIPTFVCPCGCNEQYQGDYDFSLSEVTVNNQKLTGIPLNQGSSNLCLPYSFAKQMEITKNVKAVILNRPISDSHLTNPLHLHKRCKEMLGEEPVGAAALIVMAQLLKTRGICSKDGKSLYKASNVSTIHRRDTVSIVQNLADGFPLNASFFEGRRLHTARYCRPYKPPSRAKMDAKLSAKRQFMPAHAVVLVGARRKGGRLSYHYMNSWPEFCVRRDNRGRRFRKLHGIGKIDANRLIRNVIRISRFPEDQTDRSFGIEPLPLDLETSRNFDLLLS